MTDNVLLGEADWLDSLQGLLEQNFLTKIKG